MMSVPLLLSPHDTFPDPRYGIAHYDGLVAISMDLAPHRLLAAYQRGIFPWFSQDGGFFWFCTDPRAVLLPAKLHISKSLRKTLRNKPYRITVNHAFSTVIQACANIPRTQQAGSWITPEFQTAYCTLHRLGHAHSFECWYPDEHGQWNLAGGFYGVQIGRVFYGESMFAHQADASKIAFACAVPYLQDCGIELIDCQQNTAHLARFGSELMAFDDFERALQDLNPLPLTQEIGGNPSLLSATK